MGYDEAMPVPGMPDVEMRRATLPDGTRMMIAAKRGSSQDEVDLLAARIWQETPEPGAAGG
ncbi:hypothetical protein ACFVT5_41050 [Streptomyces sp. NPDC058001]|uniref:hypothetical protein n=1 Tax=Streptomyces sp. NPDC058001 TaxID=3346300 RepID=UPI0036E80B6F